VGYCFLGPTPEEAGMTLIRMCSLVFLFTVVGMSQQPQSQNPTPSASPDSHARPTPTPEQQRASANSQIQSQLQSLLSSDPFLSDANVQVNVDDQNVTLTGTIVSEGQRQRVLQLASPYGQYRKIVDKTTIK
jgi:hypothetical protein